MFKSYNMKSCQFECRLRFAIAETAKIGRNGSEGCLPWEYPAPPGHDHLPICTSSGKNELHAFEAAMDSLDSLKGCQCPANCAEVTYETQVSNR